VAAAGCPASPLLSPEQAFDQRFSAQAEVFGNIAQNAGQCADPQGRVTRDRDVVLPAFEGRQPQVAARLTGDPVTQVSEAFARSSPETSRGSLKR
jgi:hypothetical protein